jgi:HEAT repeat protein
MDVRGIAMPSPRATFYINLLTDPNPNVRKKAVQAIGQIGDKAALFRLKAVLKTKSDAEVKAAIEQAIAAIERRKRET